MTRLIRVFAGRTGCFVGLVVLWLIYYILVCLIWVNNTDFCYFDTFYFLKLPEKAMVFMYPCTCMLVSDYYLILQMSSCTRIYLSRRSTRDEWIPQCSYTYSLLVGPRGEVRVVSLMVNGYAEIYKDNRKKSFEANRSRDYGQGTIFIKGIWFINQEIVSWLQHIVLIRYIYLWSFVTIFLKVKKLWGINNILPRGDNSTVKH